MPLKVDSLDSGTIKTESLTVAGEPVGPKYKVYTALLTQTGTNDPVANILENTLGVVPQIVRIVGGVYKITIPGGFDNTKTFTSIGGVGNDVFITQSPGNVRVTFQSDFIYVIAYDNSLTTTIDGQLKSTGIEIRVYN